MRQRVNRRPPAKAIAVFLTVVFVASNAPAQAIALYEAGTGSTVWDPFRHWGWLPEDIPQLTNPLAQPIPDDLGGLNSWSITDNALGTPNPSYVMSLDAGGPALISELLSDGWQYKAEARLVSDFGGGQTMGLSVYLGGKVYVVQLDFAASGGLQATLFPNQPIPLTSNGSAATAFHSFELRSHGAAHQTAFLFDGQEVGRWSGIAAIHPNIVRWGTSSASARGQMNFHRVEFTRLETVSLLPGDYDGDGAVNAADYTVWRDHRGSSFAAADGNGNGTVDAGDYSLWKSRFGTSNAFATSIPEPQTVILLLIGSCVLFAAARNECNRKL
jgi:hypothetical protein